MQISFVMLSFSDQFSGRGKSFQGDKLPQGGARRKPGMDKILKVGPRAGEKFHERT